MGQKCESPHKIYYYIAGDESYCQLTHSGVRLLGIKEESPTWPYSEHVKWIRLQLWRFNFFQKLEQEQEEKMVVSAEPTEIAEPIEE